MLQLNCAHENEGNSEVIATLRGTVIGPYFFLECQNFVFISFEG